MVETKVAIVIPTAEYARRADFYDYVERMDKTHVHMKICPHGQSPARNRNLGIRLALDNDCTHILFIDDDTCFPSNMLQSLLKHDVDVVTGLYLMRSYPHQAIIFDYVDERGYCRHTFLTPEKKGLVPIVGCGLGACLIKTGIFKWIDEPWIRMGELEADHWSDDLGFFKRVRAAIPDVTMFCDLGVTVGHIASMIVYPEYIDGKWYTKYNTNGTGEAAVPQQFPVSGTPEEGEKKWEESMKS